MDSAALNAAIIESSDASIIAVGLDRKLTAWNPAATVMYGWTAAEMLGHSVVRLIPPDQHAHSAGVFDAILQGEAVGRFETEVLHKSGARVPVAVVISPVRDHTQTIVGATSIARDISEDIAARRERGAYADRLQLIGDNLPVMAWVGDPDGVLRWSNRLFREFFELTPDQVEEFDWAAQIAPDYREQVEQTIRDAVSREGAWEAMIPMARPGDGRVRWMLSRAVPVGDEHGALRMRFGTATDVTEQREAELRTLTLLKEVNHRTRNMMAMIQSMARRTAATGGDFVPRLESRIAGLAATQDLLVGRDWSGVPIADLIAAQLAIADQQTSMFDLSGPDLVLAPGAAESIGMAINELATNAGRYGALSVPEGRVTLEWEVTGTSADADFVIAWRERGGPVVTEPTMTGFGSKIIEDVPRGKLCGAVEFAYAPAGFHWRLTCPTRLALAYPDAE